MFEEADESADVLRYLRDADIAHDAGLIQEAEELTKIFAKSVKTAARTAKRHKTLGRAGRVPG